MGIVDDIRRRGVEALSRGAGIMRQGADFMQRGAGNRQEASFDWRGFDPIAASGAVAKKPDKNPPEDNIVQVPQGHGGGTLGVLGWTVDGVKAAMASHASGNFGASGVLSDDFWSHPIIRKCRNERNKFLTKIPRMVTERRKRDSQARYCADWFREFRDEIYPDNVLTQWHDDEMQMGQFVSGHDWEERRDGRHRWWIPVHKPWHPSQLQYFYRNVGRSVDGGVFHATTMNKGLLVVEPGMGRWVLGQQAARQPWLLGMVFALGHDFIGDGYNFFDNLAYQERFGIGFMQYFYNADYQKRQAEASARNIQRAGAGAVIPMRIDSKGEKQEYLEMIDTPTGVSNGTFDQTETRILRRICMAYLGQDMTSHGSAGGFKQVVVLNEVLWQLYQDSASWFFDARMEIVRDPETRRDATTWVPCDGVLYNQVSRWVGWYNFGNFDCMPHYWLDATPPEDLEKREEQKSKNASEMGNAINRIGLALPQLVAGVPGVPAQSWFTAAGIIVEEAEDAAAKNASLIENFAALKPGGLQGKSGSEEGGGKDAKDGHDASGHFKASDKET